MAEPVAVDTDVLLKTAAYALGDELFSALSCRGVPAVLGLTQLIAGKQLKRCGRRLADLSRASLELERLLNRCTVIEPDDDEVFIAAALAEEAQSAGLPLDPGEAQLAAIVARRALPLFVTGDKRALAALASLVEANGTRERLVDRLACFEQVISTIAQAIGEVALRDRVCAEPEMDGAMRLACSCGRTVWDPAQLHEACASYVGALKQEVGDLLVDSLPLA